MLGIQRLSDLGFDVSKSKVTAQQAVMLKNRVEEELPSMSDIAKADNMKL